MAMLIRLVGFMAIYTIGVALLVWLNLWLLGLGDPKFGLPSDAFGFYYPLWLAFYSPAALLGAVIAAWPSPRISPQAHRRMLYYFMTLILVLFEIVSLLDLKWQWALLEYLVLIACFVGLRHHSEAAGRAAGAVRENAITHEA